MIASVSPGLSAFGFLMLGSEYTVCRLLELPGCNLEWIRKEGVY